MFFEVLLTITVFPALFVLYIFRNVLSVHSDVYAVPFYLSFNVCLCLLLGPSFIFALLFLHCPCCAPCNPFHKMSFKFPTQLCLFFSQFLPYFVFSHVLYVQCYTVQYLMFSMYFTSPMCQCPLCPRGTPCPPGIVLQVPHYFLYPLSSGCPICPPISAYYLIPL